MHFGRDSNSGATFFVEKRASWCPDKVFWRKKFSRWRGL